jgi:hypothetical protein
VKKSVLSSFILALAASILVTVPARATDLSTAELDFWYVISAAGSTDSAYTAAFGATSIVGRLNSALRFNGAYSTPKFVNVKFYQPWVVLDPNVSSCVQKALTVGAAQLQLDPPSQVRNAQLVIKVTGDVRLNEGNGGPGGGALTIVEVRSLRSIACEATFYFPDWP